MKLVLMAVVTAIRTPSELPAELYRYDLSAVITHEGKLDNGHYWACVRSGQEWFHLDDDRGEIMARTQLRNGSLPLSNLESFPKQVTASTLTRVVAQKAYMLFYVKRSLAFS
jgi:ubiquitin carboxyl-terminal hydrolase 22/27/51